MKHLVIHTYYDTERSEILNRPCWKTEVKSYPSGDDAYKGMKQKFRDYLTDNLDSLISASFSHDCAVLEYADCCKEIWTITKIDGEQ